MISRPNRKPYWLLAPALGTLSLALAACSGGGGAVGAATSPSSSVAASTTLTIAVNSAPQSFDPSRADNGNGLYSMELAYEPLIWENDNDTYSPGLATSWGYQGSGNKGFQLTIRSGAKFSDGEPVTAQAVANSLNYFTKGFGPTTGDLAGVTATATGADTVTLTSKTANPEFPLLLSQNFLAGDIISPAGLKKTGSLTSTPSGAGPYVLDSAATVSGEQYTFTANPDYYDPSRIHYKKVVIKVIADPTAELSALQTGQVNLIFGDAQQIPTAKSAGLTVTNTGAANWNGVMLLDRDGTKFKALGSPLVRQALNYAVNRAGIASAVYGMLGTPTDQPTVPGFDEYVPSLANYYSYNVAKAKQLLAQAGYPNGFSMPLTYTSFDPQTQAMVQAIAQEWSAIGVKVTADGRTQLHGAVQGHVRLRRPIGGVGRPADVPSGGRAVAGQLRAEPLPRNLGAVPDRVQPGLGGPPVGALRGHGPARRGRGDPGVHRPGRPDRRRRVLEGGQRHPGPAARRSPQRRRASPVTMLTLIARRIVMAIPLFVVVTAVTFVLESLVPGDTARALVGASGSSAAYDSAARPTRPGQAAVVPVRPLPQRARARQSRHVRLHRPASLGDAEPAAPRHAVAGDPGHRVLPRRSGSCSASSAPSAAGSLGRAVEALSLVGLALPGFWVALVLVEVFAVVAAGLPRHRLRAAYPVVRHVAVGAVPARGRARPRPASRASRSRPGTR